MMSRKPFSRAVVLVLIASMGGVTGCAATNAQTEENANTAQRALQADMMRGG